MQEYRLGSLGEAAAVLSDPREDAERRAAAGAIIAATRGPRTLPGLLNAISERDEDLVWGIANSLGTFGSRRATRPLLRIVALPERSARRAAAVYALGLLRDPRAAQALGHVLSREDETEETRALAADALGGLCDNRRALRALLANHDSPSDSVRFTVINALGNFGPNPVIDEALRSHLGDHGSYPGRSTIGELARSLLNQRGDQRS
jgi:HEAT repeat protein